MDHHREDLYLDNPDPNTAIDPGIQDRRMDAGTRQHMDCTPTDTASQGLESSPSDVIRHRQHV
jgi:hypothetical protein